MRNERSFGKQLLATFEMISPEYFKKHFGETEKFTRSIVRTRNFYTHLGSDDRAGVIRGSDLFLLNQKLHAVLRCVMLLDLGLSEELLKEPIAYEANRWSLI